MALKPILILMALLATILAGCADGGEATPADDFQLGDDLQVTEDTGIIRGVVVDAAIQPVEGVTVVLAPGDFVAQSDANGLFGFDLLEPGTYFLELSKPGYLSVQQSTDVVAGVEEPPVVKVLMEVDEAFNPYYNEETMQGFIECTSNMLVLCGAPDLVKCIVLDMCDPLTNDRYTPTISYDMNPTWVQTEIAWQSTQPAGENLYLEVETEADVNYITGNEGPSPVLITVNETVLDEHMIGGEGQGIYYSIFSGDYIQQEVPNPATGGTVRAGVGFTLQQEVTFFFHSFYGYEPAEGWRFTSGEEVPTHP